MKRSPILCCLTGCETNDAVCTTERHLVRYCGRSRCPLANNQTGRSVVFLNNNIKVILLVYETKGNLHTIEMNKLSLYMAGVVVAVKKMQSRHLYYLRSSFACVCLLVWLSETREYHRRTVGTEAKISE